MDFRYRFLTLGIPRTQSMPSRDVNAATRLLKLVGGVIIAKILFSMFIDVDLKVGIWIRLDVVEIKVFCRVWPTPTRDYSSEMKTMFISLEEQFCKETNSADALP